MTDMRERDGEREGGREDRKGKAGERERADERREEIS